MNSTRGIANCLMALVFGLVSTLAFSQVSISIGIAPPPLIVEDQPACPDDGYIWTPGYWAYDDGAYYWVPGAWVQPPQVGLLWTPSYWGWSGNAYAFHEGYWGPTVGFYGGVNYGHGYWGRGYGGGRWNGDHFAYNRAANNVAGGKFHDTYEDRSVVRSSSSRVSYNGGQGGISVQPTPEERQSEQQSHVQPTAQQQAHIQTAAQNRTHQVKVGNAKPAGSAGAQAMANPPGAQAYTGGENPGQHADLQKDKVGVPVSEPKSSPADQVKSEEKALSPNEKPAPESHPPQGVNPEVKAEHKAPTAEKHTKSGPKAADVHAKAEAHADTHDKQ